jgi:hypothetical protein
VNPLSCIVRSPLSGEEVKGGRRIRMLRGLPLLPWPPPRRALRAPALLGMIIGAVWAASAQTPAPPVASAVIPLVSLPAAPHGFEGMKSGSLAVAERGPAPVNSAKGAAPA